MPGVNDVKIAVVGSINIDYTVYVEKRPVAGETVIGSDVMVNTGGKGANQAVAAARTGAFVQMIGCVGDDHNSEIAMEALKKQNVGTAGIKTVNSRHTGMAVIMLDNLKENSIVVCPGANHAIQFADIKQSLDALPCLKLIVLQLEIPMDCVTETIKYAAKRNVKVFLDPAPVPSSGLPEEVYPLLDYISPNSIEAEMLSGIKVVNADSARNAAKKFLDKGVKNVIIKLGESGVYAVNKDEEIMFPAFKVDVVDTTAAGDTFAGAFCSRLIKGDSFSDSIYYANAAAALSVTKKGAQQSMPQDKEVEAFIKSNAMSCGK